MDNYEFCAEFASRRTRGAVLDYGCGAGEIIGILLDRGIDAYGCDVFYEGGSYRSAVPARLLEANRVRDMPDARVPFPDGFFDLVLHNQVLEHVPDLDRTVDEIARVLRPGGIMLGIFPDRTTWREGHCGIPFLHWFPKGSSARIYYAFAVRALGGGYHHGSKSRMQWAREFCKWLDDWTYYRPRTELERSFGRYFSPLQHIEAEYLEARKPTLAPLPRGAKTFIVRRWGGLVFWCERRADVPPPPAAAAEIVS